LQRYTKEVQIVIAATAATRRTMDEKEIERRKKRRIIDVDDDDDDDDNDDDKDDYDKDEDEDDESSNDVDDDEVGDKSSNPPGINDSLACPNKGREKRSGSNVANVARGCNSPPPLAQGRSTSRSGSNDATVEGGIKAPSSSHGGKKRSRLNIAIVSRGGETPLRRGINPQQTQRNIRGEKKEEEYFISPPSWQSYQS